MSSLKNPLSSTTVGAEKQGVVESPYRTVLNKAARFGNLKLVQSLIDAGNDVSIPDDLGRPAIILASTYGHALVVRALLRAGSYVEAVNKKGWTALMGATFNGDLATTVELIAAGANVNVRDTDEWTPLMWAVTRNKSEIVLALLDAGADPTYTNNSGNTAEDLGLGVGTLAAAKILTETRRKQEKLQPSSLTNPSSIPVLPAPVPPCDVSAASITRTREKIAAMIDTSLPAAVDGARLERLRSF
jgi:ankyrin repeat protein